MLLQIWRVAGATGSSRIGISEVTTRHNSMHLLCGRLCWQPSWNGDGSGFVEGKLPRLRPHSPNMVLQKRTEGSKLKFCNPCEIAQPIKSPLSPSLVRLCGPKSAPNTEHILGPVSVASADATSRPSPATPAAGVSPWRTRRGARSGRQVLAACRERWSVSAAFRETREGTESWSSEVRAVCLSYSTFYSSSMQPSFYEHLLSQAAPQLHSGRRLGTEGTDGRHAHRAVWCEKRV